MSFLKITNPQRRDQMVQDYLATKSSIKDHNHKERQGEISSQRDLEDYFKPVIESQRDFSTNVATAINELADRPLNIQGPIQQPQIMSSPVRHFGPLATMEFLKSLEHGNESDTIYGIYTKDGQKYIGNKKIKIENDDIIIDKKIYTGTPGLWELIGNTSPKEFTPEDYKTYAKILEQTNTMRRNNDPESKFPKSNRGLKWKNIIKPIWEGKSFGSGTIFLPKDPNALIERLELLLASREAGNTGVNNEIVSIIDELYRQKVINKSEYKKLSL